MTYDTELWLSCAPSAPPTMLLTVTVSDNNTNPTQNEARCTNAKTGRVIELNMYVDPQMTLSVISNGFAVTSRFKKLVGAVAALYRVTFIR